MKFNTSNLLLVFFALIAMAAIGCSDNATGSKGNDTNTTPPADTATADSAAPADTTAPPDDVCDPLCMPGWECGSNGCGGICGECAAGLKCNEAIHSCETAAPGQCVPPCGAGEVCVNGQCVVDTATYQTCSALLNDCVAQCADQGCLAACLADATEGVQGKFDELIACQQTCANPDGQTVDLKCMSQNCFDTMHECQGNGQELTCQGVLTCISSCSQTEQGCPAGCVCSAAEPQAFDAVFAVFDCAAAACPNEAFDSDCFQSAIKTGPGGPCEAELAACL